MILYAPSVDRSFTVLMRQADHIIEIAPADDVSGTTMHRSSRSPRNDNLLPCTQRTPEVS